MKKLFISILITFSLILSLSWINEREENISKMVIKNKIINEQLNVVDESIDNLIKSIWDTPVKRLEHKLNKAAVTVIKNNLKENIESEIVKQRLAAIKESISNIEIALMENKTKVGENCGWVKVCTLVVCKKYGLPENSPIATSGGTPVCLESECRVWKDKFVCK